MGGSAPLSGFMMLTSASSFIIVRLFLSVLLRRLATQNDRLQRTQLVVFDERHEVDVIVTPDDEDPLSARASWIRLGGVRLKGVGIESCLPKEG